MGASHALNALSSTSTAHNINYIISFDKMRGFPLTLKHWCVVEYLMRCQNRDFIFIRQASPTRFAIISIFM